MGNALVPTPPFDKNGARLRLAALLAPLVLGAPLLDYTLVMKAVGFALGAAFFG
jgi:hypothetical protein